MAVNLPFVYPPGATPLDADEAEGLIPSHLVSQRDLNEWEQANIAKAKQWLKKARRSDILTESFCRALHRRMFGDTWGWAGQFRKTDKNIGVDWRHIAIKLRDLLKDTDFWINNETYTLDEIAIRFHHRLVYIHAFPNGNGRHARLLADILLQSLGSEPFSWSSESLTDTSILRRNYIQALQAADLGDITLLLAFAKA